jgi:ferrous iron transport protein A
MLNRLQNSCLSEMEGTNIVPSGAVSSQSVGAGTTLDAVPLSRPFFVECVSSPEAAPEWGQWLEEIGFIPGERGMVMARGIPGGDPCVIRIGLSTFALRRAEAACVSVIPLDEKSSQ